jgi:hypothetical protein
MPKVTFADIRDLDRVLAAYHASHENVYGPQNMCQEATCVEGKWAIEWLTQRPWS